MNQKGFTLIEVMIVVAIIGLLAAIALPSYNQQIRDSRRADAMAGVVEAGGAMERYFTENNSYTGATFTGATAIFPDKSPVDGTDRFYTLVANITNGGASYNIVATAQNAQAAGNLEGPISLFSTGAKTWDEDNSGGISATENDWRKN